MLVFIIDRFSCTFLLRQRCPNDVKGKGDHTPHLFLFGHWCVYGRTYNEWLWLLSQPGPLIGTKQYCLVTEAHLCTIYPKSCFLKLDDAWVILCVEVEMAHGN